MDMRVDKAVLKEREIIKEVIANIDIGLRTFENYIINMKTDIFGKSTVSAEKAEYDYYTFTNCIVKVTDALCEKGNELNEILALLNNTYSEDYERAIQTVKNDRNIIVNVINDFTTVANTAHLSFSEKQSGETNIDVSLLKREYKGLFTRMEERKKQLYNTKLF